MARALVVASGLALGLTLGVATALLPTKAPMLLVGAGVAAVIFWRPYVGFLLVILSLPADVSGTLGSGALVQLSATKLLGSLTMLAMGFHWLVRRRFPPVRRLLTRQTVLAALLLAVTVASAFMHPTEESTAEVVRLAVIVFFVVVTLHFVDRPKRVEQVLLAIAFSGTLVAGQSLAQRVMRPVSISEQWVAAAGAVVDVGEENLGEMLRTTGTFSHPAWLGLFLSISVPLTLGLAWTARRPWLRAAGVTAAVIQVLGILSTYSRMSYVGVALAIALFTTRRRFGVAVVSVLLAGSAVAFPALPEDFRARVRSILDYTESSSSLSRIVQQKAGLLMFREHLVTGVGPGNFEADVVQYDDQIEGPMPVQAIGAHNMYLEMAAELGVFGLLLVLAILGLSWHGARRLRISARRWGDVRQAMLWECVGIGLIVFAASAAFVHAQYRKEWWLLVALIAAGRGLTGAGSSAAPREEGTT
jgi:O-antigen ligase